LPLVCMPSMCAMCLAGVCQVYVMCQPEDVWQVSVRCQSGEWELQNWQTIFIFQFAKN